MEKCDHVEELALSVPGTVKIGESGLDSLFNPGELDAYTDVLNSILYVNYEKLDFIRSSYTILEERDQLWTIKMPVGFGSFQIRPVQEMDFHATKIQYYVPFVKFGAACRKVKKGGCINIVKMSDESQFVGSFTAPTEIRYCRTHLVESCYGLIAPITVDLFDKRGCKGNLTKQAKTNLFFCAPPD